MALGMQLMTFEDMTYELRRRTGGSRPRRASCGSWSSTDAADRLPQPPLLRRGDRPRAAAAPRATRLPLSLLFIDVDRFKAINDTLGHEAGDRVLQRSRGLPVRNIREADYVFRWGGDEFLVLHFLRRQRGGTQGSGAAGPSSRAGKRPTLPPGVGLSVGCAEVPPETDDIMADCEAGGRAECIGINGGCSASSGS